MSKNYFFKCSKPLDCKKTSNLFFFLLTRNLYLVWVPTLHMQKGQIWSAGKIGDFSATVFSRFGPFGVDLGIIFSAKIRKISRFIAGTLESSTGGRNTLIKLSCHRDKFFWAKIFAEKKFPNRLQMVQNVKKRSPENRRFCRTVRPADRIWPFFHV